MGKAVSTDGGRIVPDCQHYYPSLCELSGFRFDGAGNVLDHGGHNIQPTSVNKYGELHAVMPLAEAVAGLIRELADDRR